MSVVSLLTLLSRGVMGWVNKVGEKIKDSHGLCLIINVFVIARLNKIRLSGLLHRLGMEARAEREPGALPERLVSSLIASAPQAGGSRPKLEKNKIKKFCSWAPGRRKDAHFPIFKCRG